MKNQTRYSRRGLLAAAVSATAAVPLLAQERGSTAPPTSKDEDLKSARDVIASNAAQLAKVNVPMAVEPAFVFRA